MDIGALNRDQNAWLKTMTKLAIIYQHMSPTRVPVFDALYEMLGDRMRVFYATTLEGDRDKKWSVPAHHPYYLLKARSFSYTLFSLKRYVHFNLDIYLALREYHPECVIIYNFHPTSLLAWVYTRIHRKKFIVATDGCLKSDRKNTPFHFLLRKAIIPTAVAAVGTSKGSLDLFNLYADFTQRYFNCYLCADNARFAPFRQQSREYDVMFAGQFIPRKMPHFFTDVVAEMKKTKPDVSAVLLGDGPQRQEVLARLDALGVRYRYAGFVPMEEVPSVYASARLFLFPTQLDAYGVVANEALAVGTPVISNDEPGAAREVILHDVTGYVLPLDVRLWSERALELLSQPERYRRMSDAGFAHVQKYTFQAAAQGLKNAFEYVVGH
jgi:glycosyltransferase involved in cell wall biosynthesis